MFERMVFCPTCNGNRRMVISLGLNPSELRDGSQDSLLFHSHCASCNSYVQSIQLEEESDSIPDMIGVSVVPELIS